MAAGLHSFARATVHLKMASLHVPAVNCHSICFFVSLIADAVSVFLTAVFAAPLFLLLDPIPTGFLAASDCYSFSLALDNSLSKIAILSSRFANPTAVELVVCPSLSVCGVPLGFWPSYSLSLELKGCY